MSAIRDIVLRVTAVAAVAAALGGGPASAIETAASSDARAATMTVAANEIRDAAPVRTFATVPVPRQRPRSVRGWYAPARPVAVARRDWNCNGNWCGQQFVLMLGIGF